MFNKREQMQVFSSLQMCLVVLEINYLELPLYGPRMRKLRL